LKGRDVTRGFLMPLWLRKWHHLLILSILLRYKKIIPLALFSHKQQVFYEKKLEIYDYCKSYYNKLILKGHSTQGELYYHPSGLAAYNNKSY